jgi:hypothetical protein
VRIHRLSELDIAGGDGKTICEPLVRLELQGRPIWVR